MLNTYDISVSYETDPSDWDAWSGFTVQAYSEEQARKLCAQAIGEFHAPYTLRVDSVQPVNVLAHVIAKRPLDGSLAAFRRSSCLDD